jgi:hypothetical protein
MVCSQATKPPGTPGHCTRASPERMGWRPVINAERLGVH